MTILIQKYIFSHLTMNPTHVLFAKSLTLVGIWTCNTVTVYQNHLTRRIAIEKGIKYEDYSWGYFPAVVATVILF